MILMWVSQIYQPLGDLKLVFEGDQRSYVTSSYTRDLDLDRAVVSTRYEVGGTAFTEEVFCSKPHEVLALRISASKGASVGFRVTLDSQLLEIKKSLGVDRLVLQGRCFGNVPDPVAVEPGAGACTEGSGSLGMAFAAILEVRISPGAGKIKVADAETLQVDGADWAVLLVTAASSFAGPLQDPGTGGKDPVAASLSFLSCIHDVSFDELLASHLADYQPRFQRVSINLSPETRLQSGRNYQYTGVSCCSELDNFETYQQRELVQISESHGVTKVYGWLHRHEHQNWEDVRERKNGRSEGLQGKKLSTEERIRMFSSNRDPSLVELLFQYGRYLLLASSRPGSFVANLQGVWNKDLSPAWRHVSDFHLFVLTD